MTESINVARGMLYNVANKLSNLGQSGMSEALFDIINTHDNTPKVLNDNEALRLAADYPAYWKALPGHWAAIDTYRIDDLFPLPSSRLYHTRKKLLVPGCRTGGKTVYQDLEEAHRTLGAWLAEQPEHAE